MQDEMAIELETAATEPGRRIDRAEYVRTLDTDLVIPNGDYWTRHADGPTWSWRCRGRRSTAIAT